MKTFFPSKSCLLNTFCLASRGVPFQTFGYGFAYFAGGYATPVPGGYVPAPGAYVPPPPAAGPYPYMHAQMNGYTPAAQPVGYVYTPPPGELF